MEPTHSSFKERIYSATNLKEVYIIVGELDESGLSPGEIRGLIYHAAKRAREIVESGGGHPESKADAPEPRKVVSEEEEADYAEGEWVHHENSYTGSWEPEPDEEEEPEPEDEEDCGCPEGEEDEEWTLGISPELYIQRYSDRPHLENYKLAKRILAKREEG
jgi:hypothetical protein